MGMSRSASRRCPDDSAALEPDAEDVATSRRDPARGSRDGLHRELQKSVGAPRIAALVR